MYATREPGRPQAGRGAAHTADPAASHSVLFQANAKVKRFEPNKSHVNGESKGV
jgi:hypothetical protein